MRKTILTIAIGLLVAIFFDACSDQTEGGSASSSVGIENRPLTKILDSLGISTSALDVFIDKSDYTLSLMFGETTVKTYPVVFGPNPVDDKRMEGDGCTPEGTFKMVDKYPHRSWTKFIWIDYPTPDSWTKFERSKANGEIPSGATIGGEIGIHGVPKGRDELIAGKVNWTAGCISLTTSDIEEVYQVIDKNTAIHIQK